VNRIALGSAPSQRRSASLVGELREPIVVRMGVPAAAIAQARRQGLVVIAGQGADAGFFESGVDLPRVGAEAAEVPEAEQVRRPAPPRVGDGLAERRVVAVEPA
jgi:hypothetical protein